MKIYVKRENHGEGIWMVLPATLVEAELDLCQYFGQKKSKDYAAFLSSSSSV